jgi:hypothetical protein
MYFCGYLKKTLVEYKHSGHFGDTALTNDIQMIPRWGKLDFAVLCIGDNFTLGYEDAKLVKESSVISVHYDFSMYKN